MAAGAAKFDPPFVGGNWSYLCNRSNEERFWLEHPKSRNITIEVRNNCNEEIMLVATPAQDEQNLRPHDRPHYNEFTTGTIKPGKRGKIIITKDHKISAVGLYVCYPNGQQLNHLTQKQDIYVLIRVS